MVGQSHRVAHEGGYCAEHTATNPYNPRESKVWQCYHSPAREGLPKITFMWRADLKRHTLSFPQALGAGKPAPEFPQNPITRNPLPLRLELDGFKIPMLCGNII